MNSELLPSVAREQLNLILGFFSRVEAKASVVLAIDTGMAGYLASHISFSINQLLAWGFVVSLVAFVLIGCSLLHLYWCAFPNLTGGDRSLIYFVEIAKRTENKFIEEFVNQPDLEHARDLLGQVWRNSEILTAKFRHVKRAFIFMALAILPWVIALALLATHGLNVKISSTN